MKTIFSYWYIKCFYNKIYLIINKIKRWIESWLLRAKLSKSWWINFSQLGTYRSRTFEWKVRKFSRKYEHISRDIALYLPDFVLNLLFWALTLIVKCIKSKWHQASLKLHIYLTPVIFKVNKPKTDVKDMQLTMLKYELVTRKNMSNSV